MSFDIDKVDVIYAEDQEAFRMITIPVLVKAGILEENVHIAEDGKEAIEHFVDLQAKGPRHPLLVLLDVRMPIMDGNSCAMEIKQMVDRKQAARCPYVVLLTAFLDKRVEEESHEGAVQLSVPKPLDKTQIQHVVFGFQRWYEARWGLEDGGGGYLAAQVPEAPARVPSPARPPAQDGGGGYLAAQVPEAPARVPSPARPPAQAPSNQLADAACAPAYAPSNSWLGGRAPAVVPASGVDNRRPTGKKDVPAVQYHSGGGMVTGANGFFGIMQNKSKQESSGGPKAPYNPGDINIIVAGDEMVGNMALITSLSLVGAEDDLILQAGSKSELMETFGQIQGDARPWLVFVGNAQWLSSVRQVVASLLATSEDNRVSKPYVVCADEEGEKGIKNFDATLPMPYNQADLEKVLVACHRGWTEQ